MNVVHIRISPPPYTRSKMIENPLSILPRLVLPSNQAPPPSTAITKMVAQRMCMYLVLLYSPLPAWANVAVLRSPRRPRRLCIPSLLIGTFALRYCVRSKYDTSGSSRMRVDGGYMYVHIIIRNPKQAGGGWSSYSPSSREMPHQRTYMVLLPGGAGGDTWRGRMDESGQKDGC